MSSLERKVNALNTIDSDYVENWVTESNIWQGMGVYDKVAELVDLRPGQVHLDLGCGFGHTLAAMRDEKDTTLVGVDVNPLMLMAGGERLLGPEGIVSQYYINQGYTYFGEGGIQRVFRMDPRFVPITNERVNLIADDIRSLALTKSILGKERIGSGSLVLPGSSLSLSFENYDGEPLNTEEKRRMRIREVMKEVREAAYRFMAKNIHEGGSFVLAERVSVPGDMDLLEAVRDTFTQRLGAQKKYWDYGDSRFLKMGVGEDGQLYSNIEGDDGEGELGHQKGSRVTLISSESMDHVDNVTVFVQKLVRNTRRFKTGRKKKSK